MSRRRVAKLALVSIAAVWGLTFVMAQDAIEKLPTLAFLGWRFRPPRPLPEASAGPPITRRSRSAPRACRRG